MIILPSDGLYMWILNGEVQNVVRLI